MIIGITGTLGAGKGTVATYLTAHHKRFVYYSVRNFYASEAVRSGKMVGRETIGKVAAELRAKHGPTYALEQLLSQAHGQNVVIESIRTKDEAAYIKAQGGMLWAVDAPLETRYERSAARDAGIERLTLEQFTAADAAETELREVMAMADVTINCTCPKEQLYAEVEKALAHTGHKD